MTLQPTATPTHRPMWLTVSSCLSLCLLLPLLLPGEDQGILPLPPVPPRPGKMSMCLARFPVPLSISWVQATFPQSQIVISLSLAASCLPYGLNTDLLRYWQGGGRGAAGGERVQLPRPGEHTLPTLLLTNPHLDLRNHLPAQPSLITHPFSSLPNRGGTQGSQPLPPEGPPGFRHPAPKR